MRQEECSADLLQPVGCYPVPLLKPQTSTLLLNNNEPTPVTPPNAWTLRSRDLAVEVKSRLHSDVFVGNMVFCAYKDVSDNLYFGCLI